MSETTYEKRLTGFIIHGFSTAHAVAAALLSQTLVGDEAVLTMLTVSMIISIAKVNNRSWGVGDGLSVIGTLGGHYLGTRGAVFLVKWIPVLGNATNAVVTFGVTELLGWMTYLLVKEGKKPGDLSKSEKDELRSRAQKLQKKEKETSKKLYESMTPEDKAEFEGILEQMKNKELPAAKIKDLAERLESIAKNYISEEP